MSSNAKFRLWGTLAILVAMAIAYLVYQSNSDTNPRHNPNPDDGLVIH